MNPQGGLEAVASHRPQVPPCGARCLLYCLTGMQTQLPVILGFQEPGNAEVRGKLFN